MWQSSNYRVSQLNCPPDMWEKRHWILDCFANGFSHQTRDVTWKKRLTKGRRSSTDERRRYSTKYRSPRTFWYKEAEIGATLVKYVLGGIPLSQRAQMVHSVWSIHSSVLEGLP